jgi:hypothetical protein
LTSTDTIPYVLYPFKYLNMFNYGFQAGVIVLFTYYQRMNFIMKTFNVGTRIVTQWLNMESPSAQDGYQLQQIWV